MMLKGDVATIAQDYTVDLVVIGPEEPLVQGLADELRSLNIPVVGPSRAPQPWRIQDIFQTVYAVRGFPRLDHGRTMDWKKHWMVWVPECCRWGGDQIRCVGWR